MTIETRLDGDPGSIRANADWLRGRLADKLDRSVTDMFAARDDAGSGWQGEAGPAFTSRMDAAGRKSDSLRADVETAAQGFHRYADDLTTAQAGMERARSIARDGGLQLAGTTILEPVPTPDAADYAAKANAFILAKQEADRANAVMDSAKAIAKNVLDDIRSKPLLVAGDFVNGIVGTSLDAHTSVLRKHSTALLDDAKRLTEHYLKTAGGTPQSKALVDASYKRFLDADSISRRASSLTRRVETKLPVIGAGLTVAGIGYDIHHGKPAGKAIISGVGGAGAAILAGAAIGAPAGPVGILAGAAVGTVAGLVASGALDWGYDQLPEGAKKAIEDGVSEVGNAIGDGAKKVWDSLF